MAANVAKAGEISRNIVGGCVAILGSCDSDAQK